MVHSKMIKIMEQYLLEHNLCLMDFYILVLFFVIGCAILFFMWRRALRLYKEEHKNIWLKPSYLLTDAWICASCLMTIVLAPYIICGLWHFINMVAILNYDYNLYWLLDYFKF